MSSSTTSLLQITVNGAALATASETLADLVVEQGFGGSKVATAMNGEFVAERLRASTKLSGADRIEILSVRQGG